MLPNVFSSQFLTLDIAELRTPRNLVADRLTTPSVPGTSNLMVPSSNAFYGSFATIPVKVSGGAQAIYSNTSTFTNTSVTINSEFYNANYRIWQEFPSRIDKIDRLTITWRQPNNGAVFVDNNFSPSIDLGRNMFVLRFETTTVPMSPDRPLDLPDPVPWDSGERQRLIILVSIALAGLLVIISIKNRNV
jgi:hypothetical protein